MTSILICDPFVEYELPADVLEGKSLHTVKTTQDMRNILVDLGFQLDTGKWKTLRKSRTTVANRQFEALTNHLEKSLTGMADAYSAGTLGWDELSRRAKIALKQGYHDTYKIGLRGSGVNTPMSVEDIAYVNSAYQQEMKYFNIMMKDLLNGKLRGKIQRRFKAYVDTLKHVYYAARIAGTPHGWVIDWIAPLDRNTCPGCRFMSDNSPYTRSTIPTTPKAGDTSCLNNCRCRLIIRHVGTEKADEIERKHPSKRTYGEKLKRIKAYNTLKNYGNRSIKQP